MLNTVNVGSLRGTSNCPQVGCHNRFQNAGLWLFMVLLQLNQGLGLALGQIRQSGWSPLGKKGHTMVQLWPAKRKMKELNESAVIFVAKKKKVW
jgi:hypothetical protein